MVCAMSIIQGAMVKGRQRETSLSRLEGRSFQAEISDLQSCRARRTWLVGGNTTRPVGPELCHPGHLK